MKKLVFLLLTLLITQGISAQQPTVSIHLNEGPSITQTVNQPFVDPGFTATDSVSNDYSADVTVTGVVNTTMLGLYQLHYSIPTTIANAAPVIRIVSVVDNVAPIIMPLGPLVITGTSNTFEEPGLKLLDNYYDNQTLQGLVTITSTPNVKVEGNIYTLLDNNPGCIFYHLTDPSGNKADSATRCFQRFSVGLTETSNSHIGLYPNPANNRLNIQSELRLDKCHLMDLSGKTYQLSAEKTATGFVLDISSFDNGIYVFILESDGQQYYSKLVITHNR